MAVHDAPLNRRSADQYGVTSSSRAATAAVTSGVLALVVALAAVLADTGWLVGLAAILALASAIFALLRGKPRSVTEPERIRPAAALAAPAVARRLPPASVPSGEATIDGVADPRLPTEADDEARAAAARFEADAIRARDELIVELRGRSRTRASDRPPATGEGDGPPISPAPARPLVGPVERGDEVITDAATGVFSQVFFDASLEKRVAASRRGLRPLSVAVIDVDINVADAGGVPANPVPVAGAMIEVFRDADTVARAEDGRFLVLLEDTPENGAVWCLERLRRRISETLPGHTTRAGLSCYPAYGFSGEQLMAQARTALDLAREWPQDRIEVTTESPD